MDLARHDISINHPKNITEQKISILMKRRHYLATIAGVSLSGCVDQTVEQSNSECSGLSLDDREGVIELFSHRDDRASRIVSAFVVGDSDDEAKAQREEHLCSCVDAASGVRSPEAAALH